MSAVDFAAFVEKLADAASEAVLPFFRTSLGAIDKNAGGPFDPVTEADHAAESAMRQLIEMTFPRHGIIGEEFGTIREDAEYVWVLDPIDGTKSFIAGMPIWGTLIGLLHHGQPIYGMMAQPFIRERFAGDGQHAEWRGPGIDLALIKRTLRARTCASLADAILMTTSPLLYEPAKLEAFRRVEAEVRLSRYGCDCYAFAMLAAGHVDCVIESGLKPYDIAPLVPIIRGAGGCVTTWEGGEPAQGGDIVASGCAALHDQVLSLLRQRS
ncbi:histidinol-phosphatase [Beijerinckia indica]|uniref:Histidinol-phosphatase n=1 Tax=Beijerinckia indica subsp. indica (strain ATCC 9039 / DSM 1715 / NCIMB 8712) TaxID=395963 RepID=B2IGB7_BEII9|nr:histidinol-phosphatase [Beijerinckia indica]ACB97194.1 histidinol-phosphate phosphatase [Beijerinckia indica subsp. indica ATCC 9039]